MRTFATLASLAAFVQTVIAQQALFINTPAALVVCQPQLLQFGGGSGAPYFISVLPAGQPTATPILQLPQQSSTSYSWIVNLPAGTNLTLSIRDSSGAVQYSSPTQIQAGISTDCIDQAGASSASAVGAVGGGASSTAASATTGAPTTAASSAASRASTTLVSSAASATVTAAAGVPSMTPSTNGTAASAYNFTCGPTEGDLTYGITVVSLDGVSLEEATTYFGNWTGSAPGPVTNSTGSGVGATRAYTLGGNVTYEETLVTQETNSSTRSLHQQWNFTEAGPVAVTSNLTLYNAFNDLTVYTNTTSNETSVQYFVLACFSNQAQGLTAIAQTIQSTVAFFARNVNDTTPAAPARRLVKLF